MDPVVVRPVPIKLKSLSKINQKIPPLENVRDQRGGHDAHNLPGNIDDVTRPDVFQNDRLYGMKIEPIPEKYLSGNNIGERSQDFDEDITRIIEEIDSTDSDDSAGSEFDFYLSEKFLRDKAGMCDLSLVSNITFNINTLDRSIDNIGQLLPNLIQLKLSNSVIHTIRDLGTQLQKLEILWIDQCELRDLDGILALTNLKELYASFNEINSLGSISLHDKIEVIDLESNKISSMSDLKLLVTCKSLTSITLQGNPIASDPTYISILKSVLPKLEYIDDQPIEISVEVQNDLPLSEEKLMISEGIRQNIDGSHKLIYKPSNKLNYRPSTAGGYRTIPSAPYISYDTSSELTRDTDGTLAGNPMLTLRKKKKNAEDPFPLPMTISHVGGERDLLLSELRAFKIESKIFEDIKSTQLKKRPNTSLGFRASSNQTADEYDYGSDKGDDNNGVDAPK